MSDADLIVIGGGMAGASVAAHLAATRRVILLEAEERCGYHSTGRSAALFTEIYGNASIRGLTRASRAFLFEPPSGFTQGPLVRPRGCLYIATAEQRETLEAFASSAEIAPATRRVSLSEALSLCPVLRAQHLAAALYEPGSVDIDVAALHQGYLRQFRGRDGRLLVGAPVQHIERSRQLWHVRAGGHTLAAPILINAAGAWADEIAALAGVATVGLVPHRRTAILVDPPAGIAVGAWPFVNDIDERFYFKPEAGRLFLSPADETPTSPGDAQPEEWDIALAVERVEAATTLRIERLQARWAGLRTFAADRSPVVGFAPDAEGFFWLAGQGGYGIQTAAALSRAAAALALALPLPADLVSEGVSLQELAPERFKVHGERP